MNKINPISFIVRFILNRASLNDGTLKEQYSTVTRIGAMLACLLGLLSFYGLQRFEPDVDIENEGQIIIENIEIPETQQFETPPPPARPSIPIESEDEDLADDLTIEETDLDSFDAWDAPPPPPSGPQFKFIPYDDPPRPITPIKPVYPDIAQEAGIEGQVLIQCFIDKSGRVKETIVIKGIPNTGLNESAVTALRKQGLGPLNSVKPQWEYGLPFRLILDYKTKAGI